MAIKWCEHVDGISIFPKLPVYLRTHHSKWQRNQRVKDAVERAAAGEAQLRELNARTGPVPATALPPPLPPAMPQTPSNMPPVQGAAVGGVMIDRTRPTAHDNNRKRKNGQRGKDTEAGGREKRRCKYCLMNGQTREDAADCPGSAPTGTCTGDEGGTAFRCTKCGVERCKCPMPKVTN